MGVLSDAFRYLFGGVWVVSGDKVLRINYDYQAPLNPMQKAADALINNFMHAKDLSANLIRSK